MRVLVTGVAGYLGRAVARGLAEAGHEVRGLVRREFGHPAQWPTVCVGDLRDRDAMAAAVADVEVVCHLAGLTRARESRGAPLRYFDVNVGGTVTLLEAMDAAGVHGLVFASTASIYRTPAPQPMAEEVADAPPHPYAASKQAAEQVIAGQAEAGRLGAIILRLFNIASGDDPDQTRIIPRALAVARGDTPRLSVNGDGTVVRDYLHIEDAARAFTAAVTRIPEPGGHRRYNIGSGTGTSINDLVAAVERVTGRPVPIDQRPPAAEPQRLICDPGRAQRELHWAPSSSDIDTLIRDTRPPRVPPPLDA